jgi:hypothetical protein
MLFLTFFFCMNREHNFPWSRDQLSKLFWDGKSENMCFLHFKTCAFRYQISQNMCFDIIFCTGSGRRTPARKFVKILMVWWVRLCLYVSLISFGEISNTYGANHTIYLEWRKREGELFHVSVTTFFFTVFSFLLKRKQNEGLWLGTTTAGQKGHTRGLLEQVIRDREFARKTIAENESNHTYCRAHIKVLHVLFVYWQPGIKN